MKAEDKIFVPTAEIGWSDMSVGFNLFTTEAPLSEYNK